MSTYSLPANFKVGDRVRTKCEVVLSGVLFPPGAEVQIISPGPSFCLVASTVRGPTPSVAGTVLTLDLEYIIDPPVPALPVGQQQQLFGVSMPNSITNEMIDNADVSFRKADMCTACDCGGLKTHGSLESIFHSHWCSSQKA